jgi:hypothetical protein
MISRFLDKVAPRRLASNSETGYRRMLRWAALPVTNRRWAAPLAAIALGFGLFAGVAIGPGAAGTLATAPYQVIEMPSLLSNSGNGEEEAVEAEEEPAIAETGEASGGFGGEEEASSGFVAEVPLEGEETFEPAEEEQETPSQVAAPKEEEPVASEDQELAGTVVHVNAAAGSYTVAETGGVMSAIHAGKTPAAGTQVEVPIRSLANGTLAEAGKRHRTGSKKRATLAGIVTYVGADPAVPAYAVSNRGTSLLVHVAAEPSGTVPPLPALGAYATVTAGIDGAGLLWQQQLTSGGAPFTHSDFEGIVAAFEPETKHLLISADDRGESGQNLTFAVPAGIDASAFAVGGSVLASADIGADGSLTLTGLASDEHLKGAEDEAATQGDLVPEKPKGQE